MNLLVKFYWDCGRNGYIESIFITNEDELNFITGKRVYFGEVLGKHSEISGTVASEDLQVISTDQDFINKCLEVFETTTISGYNPITYYQNNNEE